MNRRDFFKLESRNVAEIAVNVVDEVVTTRVNWIRPPFALSEMDFLITCTRCQSCVAACSQKVIFPLSVKSGVTVVRTPAMGLLNKACLLCEDWPCVTACKSGALKRPDDEGSMPQLARVSIDKSLCLPWIGPECGGCSDSCPFPETLLWSRDMKPSVNSEKCVGCGLCRQSCILECKAISIAPNEEALSPC